MKGKITKKPIIFCVIAIIPVAIKVFQESPDIQMWAKLLRVIVYGFSLFFGSGMLAVVCSIAIYYINNFMVWLLDGEAKGCELGTFIYPSWGVLFIIAYIELMSGKIFGGIL